MKSNDSLVEPTLLDGAPLLFLIVTTSSDANKIIKNGSREKKRGLKQLTIPYYKISSLELLFH